MNGKVPVLHVINECDDGSISRIVERIIRFSGDPAFQWYVCAVSGLRGFEDIFAGLGAQVFDASPGGTHDETTAAKIRKIIKEKKIRIVHSHTPRTILNAWQALRGGFDHHPSHPIHLATKHLLTTPRDRRLGLFYSLFDRLTLFLPDHVVTVSDQMAQVVKNQPGVQSDKITSIPNGIPVETFHRPDLRDTCRERFAYLPDHVVLGFTGRIQKVKNLDLLIHAFARLESRYPNLRLAIAGDGDLRTDLESLSVRLGMGGKIRWLGFFQEIPAFLAAIDIYIQPSLNEGLSLSILEAMAAGKTVIATDVGGAAETIQNGHTGLLIEPGSIDAVVNNVSALMDNPEKISTLGRNAKEFVFQKYSVMEMVGSYLRLYRDFAAREIHHG